MDRRADGAGHFRGVWTRLRAPPGVHEAMMVIVVVVMMMVVMMITMIRMSVMFGNALTDVVKTFL